MAQRECPLCAKADMVPVLRPGRRAHLILGDCLHGAYNWPASAGETAGLTVALSGQRILRAMGAVSGE
jgi:hypothetical protein